MRPLPNFKKKGAHYKSNSRFTHRANLEQGTLRDKESHRVPKKKTGFSNESGGRKNSRFERKKTFGGKFNEHFSKGVREQEGGGAEDCHRDRVGGGKAHSGKVSHGRVIGATRGERGRGKGSGSA